MAATFEAFDNCEITLEANPDDSLYLYWNPIEPSVLIAEHRVQSLNDELLSTLTETLRPKGHGNGPSR